MLKYVFLALFFLTMLGCQATAMITAQSFDAISVGSEISQIQSQYGAPYQVSSNNQGFQEYLYIERIDISHTVTDQVHYIFVVLNGKVIDKRIQTSERRTLNFRTP